MNNRDGGPAFPQSNFTDGAGMSLRDYFAAKALVGLLPLLPKLNESTGNEDELAASCYELADAMLRAREGK